MFLSFKIIFIPLAAAGFEPMAFLFYVPMLTAEAQFVKLQFCSRLFTRINQCVNFHSITKEPSPLSSQAFNDEMSQKQQRRRRRQR